MTGSAKFAVATKAGRQNLRSVRRRISLGCLLFAWLCANGALWNVVQVVAWAKMYHDYAQIMPAARALQITCDGSAPCDPCRLSQSAEETARQQLPRDAALGGGMEKILLVAESLPVVVVTAPEFAWPGVGPDAGSTRSDKVPVPPPRGLG